MKCRHLASPLFFGCFPSGKNSKFGYNRVIERRVLPREQKARGITMRRKRGWKFNMRKKQLLCAVMSVVMIFTLTACGTDKDSETSKKDSVSAEDSEASNEGAVSAEDAEQPEDKDFIYDKLGDYVELTGYQGKDEVLLVPNTIEGLPVVADAFNIKENAHVREIVFEEGYTNIPNISCESNDNSPIESIKIPSTCTEAGIRNPFVNLPYLKSIEVESGNTTYSVEDGILYAIYGDGYKLLVCYPSMKEGEVFSQPDETHLAEFCFANNHALKRVENAKAWNGVNAFEGSSIEEIVCSERWTFLGQHEFEDFSGESKIRSITLSANLNDVVWKVQHFAGLDKLEEILVPDSNTTFFSENGVLYYIGSGETYLFKYPNAHAGEDFTISEKADMIYYMDTVFENPVYLKRVHVKSDWKDLVHSSDFPNGIEVVVD